jgi:diguanylate cyclase (GGDEF)-like protein
MTFVMTVVILVYIIVTIFCIKNIVAYLEGQVQKELDLVESKYQKILNVKKNLYQQKLELENEALEVFTLYEMTRKITTSFSEEDAFKTFQTMLSKHVDFEKCLYLDPLDDEVSELRKSNEHFFFTLQGKRKCIGFLAVKGLKEEDKEKFMILSHQFALAIRRIKLYQEIEKIAITDSLTELHTRRYTLQRLQEEIQRSKLRKIKISFLMIDVDYFKSFNDKFGHLTGDQILRELGVIIKDNVREIDTAGRYGGEEFCVILPDTDRDGAQYAAERIRKATEDTEISAYDAVIKSTLSVGIATFPDDAKKMEELIDKADWALYRAKKLGRNRVCAFGVYK